MGPLRGYEFFTWVSLSEAVSYSRGSVSPRLTPRQCRGFPSLGETRPRGHVFALPLPHQHLAGPPETCLATVEHRHSEIGDGIGKRKDEHGH